MTVLKEFRLQIHARNLARKLFVTSIAIAAPLLLARMPHASAQSPPPLAERIQKVMSRPEFTHANFGIKFVSLDTGKVLYSINSNKLFVPASTTKLLTEGTLLAKLGADYRFHTRIYRTAPIDKKGKLKGDLILVASGDPNLLHHGQRQRARPRRHACAQTRRRCDSHLQSANFLHQAGIPRHHRRRHLQTRPRSLRAHNQSRWHRDRDHQRQRPPRVATNHRSLRRSLPNRIRANRAHRSALCGGNLHQAAKAHGPPRFPSIRASLHTRKSSRRTRFSPAI